MSGDGIGAQGGGTSAETWRRLAVLGLAVVVVGLPINSLALYAVLAAAVVAIWSGSVTARPVLWIAAFAMAVAAVVLQAWTAPPRFDEGHNAFLPNPVLEAGLPPDVYRVLAAAFDARYPQARACDPRSTACWRARGGPDRVYAFSADGIFHRSDLSRAVNRLDVSDPVRLRLGFTNELAYNWYGGDAARGDLERAVRDRRFWMGLDRWHLTMPWFEMVRLPQAYVGSHLCWRGEVLWESDNGRFDRVPHAGEACRAVTAADVGRRIFGVAVAPESLTMRLQPPAMLRLQRMVPPLLAAAGVVALLLLVVRVRMRRLAVPALLLALALVVIAIDDAAFIGGLRPFDGGDDGLFYDGLGRAILQAALAGDWAEALKGGEAVFYYGGPGLRYARALEHLVFGETALGYLTLVLVLPFAVWMVLRRFLDPLWALALTLIFVAVPVGTLFGTSFVNYAQWAGRGFADPAAYIFFICGLVPVLGASAAPPPRFLPALGGGFLMALAIFMKPIVAPACAVLLAGAGLAALHQRQWLRLAGLCLGFAPVFLITLHNWVFGGVFVLFSANAAHPLVLTMPPSAYGAALGELAGGEIGDNVRRGLWQVLGFLRGPSESYALIPVSAAGVAVTAYVAGWGRRFDPWLRLVAGAALAQHAVALFYVATARYHFLAWFLTLVVTAAWCARDGVALMQRHCPGLWRRFIESTALRRTTAALRALETMQSQA